MYNEDKYIPLSDMPQHIKEGDCVPVKVYVMMSEVLDGGEESTKEFWDFCRIFGANGANKLTFVPNGSFHEYNWAVYCEPTKGLFYNKYLARDHSYSNERKWFAPVDKDHYISDFNLVFISNKLSRLVDNYDPVHWLYTNDREHGGPSDFRGEVSLYYSEDPAKDQVRPFVEEELVRAVRNWEISKKNYDESKKWQLDLAL